MLTQALAGIANRFDAVIAADGTGSLSAAVLNEGHLVWTYSAGWADRENRQPASTETIYRVGSISKTVLAVAALRLDECGVLAIDDPVARYVPEIETVIGYAEQRCVITLRDLATHTSGLSREPRIPKLLSGALDDWDKVLLNAIPCTRFAHAPRSRFEYSNIGAAILGMALQRSAATPFTKLVSDEISSTLGLGATRFQPPEDLTYLATGYEQLVDGSISSRKAGLQHKGRGFRLPSGGMYSRPSEIATLFWALSPRAPNVLLSHASRQSIILPTIRKSEECPPGPSNAYGLGVELYLKGTEIVAYGHHGDMTGYGAIVLSDPVRGVTICVCSNFRSSENLGIENSIGLLQALVNDT